MLRDYPDTEATYKALKYMEIAYKQMGLDVEANKVNSLLAANAN